MATHQSAVKRIRQINSRNERNSYYAKTMRSSVKEIKNMKDKKEAEKKMDSVISHIDKLARMNIIHKNKAANLKSSVAKHVNSL